MRDCASEEDVGVSDRANAWDLQGLVLIEEVLTVERDPVTLEEICMLSTPSLQRDTNNVAYEFSSS